ncbi:4768_t:CDS:2, partial [Gigaspora rosea]
ETYLTALESSSESSGGSEVVLEASSMFVPSFVSFTPVPSFLFVKDVINDNEREEILPAAPNFNNLPLIVCNVPQLLSIPTSVSIFYESDDSGNFSDGCIIDEARRQLKEEKFKISITTPEYDLAGNTYFQKEEAKPDPWGHILAGFTKESN